MYLTRTQLALLVDIIANVILCLLNNNSIKVVTVITLFNCFLLFLSVRKIDGLKITISSAILLYTLATQFGLFLPYILLGRETAANYSDYTLRFMNPSNYHVLTTAVMLANTAVVTYEFGRNCSSMRYKTCYINLSDCGPMKRKESNNVYYTGIALLVVVLIYFLFHIATGGMKLFASYEEFRSSSAYQSNLYSYILILFYVSTIYLYSSGDIRNRKLGWCIWFILVVIFALNGNKGEFMYALLAVIGMRGVEGKKMSAKTVLVMVLLLFFIIPGITSMRSIGIMADTLENHESNIWSAFTEMGMQLRMSVYTIQGLQDGTFNYLLGKSYWVPFVNMIPFTSIRTATASIRHAYPGHGFSQVIESYVNFGLLGVVVFFGAIGYLFKKWESNVSNALSLAYLGTICCIMINATRNYFAFVPGQIVIVSLLYLFLRNLNGDKNWL